MSRVRIAVYGSLREGEYNYERIAHNFGKSSIRTLASGVKVSGYDLYDLGPYPAISKGENELIVDVISVDSSAYTFIKRMELGAGYQEDSVKIKSYGDVLIYTFPPNSFPENRLVPSGDWSEHLKTR